MKRNKSLKMQKDLRIKELRKELSECKQADGELLKGKIFSDKAINTLPGTFYLFNDKGKIILWNTNLEKISEYKAEVISLMSPLDFFCKEDRERVAEKIREVFDEGESAVEANFLTKSGKTIPYYLTGVRMRMGDKTYLVGVGIDITERRRAEKQIKASLEEKNIRLKEVHHRVKNNLQVISSLLSLQSMQIRDEQDLEYFRESQNRIRSIAFIHEKLYQTEDSSRLNFRNYLETLVTYLFQSYGVNQNLIKLEMDVEEIQPDFNTVIMCGLILNELVSNSLKHAFPEGREGEIRIILHRGGDNLVTFVVCDNGVGLPEDLDFRNTESLGLHLVKMFSDQLEGSIEVDRNNGTTFKITFPEPDATGISS